jgi:signal transduction histidine kinase
MLIGTGGLAVGFALGGVVLVAAFGYAFQREIDAEALGTARSVADLLNAGRLPEPIPVAGSQLVQVVDAQGRVRNASIGADRLVPLVRPAEFARVRRHPQYVNGDRAGLDMPLRVVAVPAGPAGDPQTVIVARQIGELRQSSTLLRSTLLIAYPLLVFVPAVVAWRVMGATLRSVDELRAGAEDITGADPGAGAGSGGSVTNRLPVPAAHDEIHRLAVTLNDMLDRLAAARARQRAFVADAAHELRSPLTNMRTELEVAQRLDEPVRPGELLADIQRLSRLVDDLLLLARADEGVPLAHPGPVRLDLLVAEVVSRYAGAEVPVAAEGGPLWTIGDPDVLTRVLTNLLDNAVRHARTGVRVAVSAEGRYTLVTVTDDGPGIPTADRERVFDRFTRLDDARARDAGGAGLGLAIVRELVRRHGGTVRLADAGPGVRAEVRLRAHKPADLGVVAADKSP